MIRENVRMLPRSVLKGRPDEGGRRAWGWKIVWGVSGIRFE